MLNFPRLSSSQPYRLFWSRIEGDETVKFSIRQAWTNLDVPLSWNELQLLEHISLKPQRHCSLDVFNSSTVMLFRTLKSSSSSLHFFFWNAKRRKDDTSWTKVKIVILFQMHYLGFSPLHLAQACTRLYGKHNTLVPPRNHPWRNTLFLGGKYFLWERRGPAESRSDFSAWLFCCSDLFWNLSDFRRLAHAEGVAVFGKRLWSFWQNRS